MRVGRFLNGLLVASVSLVGGIAGEMEVVKADAQKGFHQDYLLLVPERVRTNCVIVVATPTPKTSDDPAEFRAAAERIAKNAGPLIGELGLPVMVPVLPRPPLEVSEGQFIDVYYPALTRAAMETTGEKFARMDRQVLAMLDDARQKLGLRGVRASEKSIFVGFSAAGHFATRMAVLHPERVRAVWAGGLGGHAIVPTARLGGKELTYPVGVGDLKEVTGADFNAQALSGISVMFVQGGTDTNTSLPGDRKPSDSYTFEQAELVREVLGTNSLERLEKVTELWEKAGAKVEMKVYREAGHQMTPEIVRDMIGFIGRCAGEKLPN